MKRSREHSPLALTVMSSGHGTSGVLGDGRFWFAGQSTSALTEVPALGLPAFHGIQEASPSELAATAKGIRTAPFTWSTLSPTISSSSGHSSDGEAREDQKFTPSSHPGVVGVKMPQTQLNSSDPSRRVSRHLLRLFPGSVLHTDSAL